MAIRHFPLRCRSYCWPLLLTLRFTAAWLCRIADRVSGWAKGWRRVFRCSYGPGLLLVAGNCVLLRNSRTMSFFTFCPWIETTSLSIAIREGALYCPILGTFHLAAIAWFGGMVLVGDLTVLRIGLREVSASQILEQFSRWKWVDSPL
jgi:hypothetical protein